MTVTLDSAKRDTLERFTQKYLTFRDLHSQTTCQIDRVLCSYLSSSAVWTAGLQAVRDCN